ncbi:hypothetical protein CANARDRAFT_26549 [[Candida] arabinofermentans NRRL YB-2248]|uniref:Uncharacterized protein n=1 Tax=[Candida] arabinofermentans NRRL YB-2248 TaxID=983967 RepID=A0A1E4T5U2_9ASCO|nr:hypothetical protein CANARDRAFT_26549 [[Candida] arabinofermentans NRRL YB-2248]
MYIKAASRTRISKSIFSTTFFVAFSLVLANSIVPCPVDRPNNDSQISNELRKEILKNKIISNDVNDNDKRES